MSQLRAHLKDLLARKVERYGVVVWEDPEKEYEGLAQAVCPPDTTFKRWCGSWYRLRREIEPFISGPLPERLVIYQPIATPPPEADPLAEVRLAGTVCKVRLRALIREALAGRFTEARIEELTQARTLVEAEAALAGGEGTGVRLPAVLGTADTMQLALRILADDTDQLLTDPDLWEEARRVLAQAFGGQPRGEGDALRDWTFRHLVRLELEDALGQLPEMLRGTVAVGAEQRRRARDLLRMWRHDPARLPAYRERALRAQQDLGLREALHWDDALAELDTLPLLEELAFQRVVGLLDEGKPREAAALAEGRRGTSVWVRGELPEAETWGPRWEAASAVAGLGAALAAAPVPKAISVDALLSWYANGAWQVDRAHRRMEAALTEVPVYGELTGPVATVRRAYEAWLEQVLERFTGAVEREGLESALERQSSVHKTRLAKADEVTAYLLVDALRYELGMELADALRGTAAEVEVAPALATAPTITPVGMASLMPGAELGLKLEVADGQLGVAVNGRPTKNVADRVALLRAAHGEVADFLLTDLFDHGEDELRRRIGSAKVVLVRSQEVDEVFESDHTAAAWRYVKELRTLIARAVARLTAAGIGRFVIASDHGFLILSRGIDQGRTIASPGGTGELHRRCWIGQGGTTSESTLRLPLSRLGVEGEAELIVPRGLAIFSAGGARRFFHGGLSPQELLVPVITARTAPTAAAAAAKVVADVAGSRVTTGVFSATLQLEPNLFTSEMPVQVIARNRAGEESGRVITGEGYDEGSGTVLLKGGRAQVITLRVTRPLAKGDRLILEIHDAQADRLLARSKPAEVVAQVQVGDELG